MIIIARDIEQELSKCTSQLLELAQERSWSKVPKNAHFIITKIDINDVSDPIQLRKKYKKPNSKKKPKTLSKIAYELEKFYMDIYDINLYIHKISKDNTTIDIRYLLKSSLTPEYQKTVIDNKPMLHCKIPVPIYVENGGKFNLNWVRGGFMHHLRSFLWYRKRTRKRMRKRM